MITPSTLTTSPIHFSLNGWDNVRFERMGVKGLSGQMFAGGQAVVESPAFESIAVATAMI